MDLAQLRYFLCVAEQNSFTQAARLLDMAQPSLSRQVRLLEVELRQNLLIRNGRGVTTTEAGKVLVRHARRILDQVELAHEELQTVRGAVSGHVAVGLPPSLSKVMAASLIDEFGRRLPGAQLSISDGLSVSMQEWLLRGQLDIALLFQPQPSADISITPLLEEELFLIGAAGGADAPSTITLREIADLPLILPRRPHEIRVLLEDQLAFAGCRPRIALEVDNIPAILDLVAGGARYTVLPRYVVPIYADARAYRVRRIVGPSLVSKLAVAVSSRRKATPTQQAALDIIQEVCASALRGLDTNGRHAATAAVQ